MDPLVEVQIEVQNTIRQVLPLVLIGPGLLLTGSGLFIWLGGLRWMKSMAAFSAALAGLVCAWYFTDHQLAAMVLFPVILAGLGIYFHKVVVVVLGGVTAGVLVLLIPVIANASQQVEPVQQYQPAEKQMDLLESIDWVQEKIEAGKQAIRETIRSVPVKRKNLAIAAAIIVCILGLVRWRLVCAATCSLLGTTLIFCGMAVLLLYKGAEAFKQMIELRYLLGLSAIGMIVVGILIQLMLCPAEKKKTGKDEIKKELLKEEGKK